MELQENLYYSDQVFDKTSLPITGSIDTQFDNCTFKNCDFTVSDFFGCDFLTCKFDQCNLSMVKFGHNGFDKVIF